MKLKDSEPLMTRKKVTMNEFIINLLRYEQCTVCIRLDL